MITSDKSFRTSDLPLAATLVACGYDLSVLDRSDTRRAVFVFSDSEALRATIERFWKDALEINPRLFADTLRKLKSQLYGERP